MAVLSERHSVNGEREDQDSELKRAGVDDTLPRMTAAELTAEYALRRLSPVEAIEALFSWIDRVNPYLNAYCWLDRNAAVEAAKASEARWARAEPVGPLDGVPVSVKDLSLTAGWPTRRGSIAIPSDRLWTDDAPSVARCREAGAVLFGKTTVPELGAKGVTRSRLHGVTRNPWDLSRTPGGSSGGAAASVASFMGPVALASDGAGSIRNPAALTGVFGFKPSYGVVPDYPPSYLGSLAVVGSITRTVRDAAATMSVISRMDARDPHAVPFDSDSFLEGLEDGIAGLRVAYSPTLGYAAVDPEIAASSDEACCVLEGLGARVTRVESVVEDPSAVIDTLMAAGLANAFVELGLDENDHAQMDTGLVGMARRGAGMSALDYLEARRRREAIGTAMRLFLNDYDLLVTPMMPIAAFDADADGPDDLPEPTSNWKPFSGLFNLTKQPAAAVPCGLTRAGLPIALQIIGPIFGDALVMRAARAFEGAQPFASPRLDWLGNKTPEGSHGNR